MIKRAIPMASRLSKAISSKRYLMNEEDGEHVNITYDW
jgi:hypothetical protein